MRIANNDDRNSGGFGFSFDYNRGWQLEFSDNGSIVVQDPFKEVVETGDEIRIKVYRPWSQIKHLEVPRKEAFHVFSFDSVDCFNPINNGVFK
jgi:hypothetical protein